MTVLLKKIFLYYFIYFWLHWVFVAARGLSLVAGSKGYSSLQCAGFSLRWLLLLWRTGSRRAGFSSCGSQALESRLSSCGARVLLLRGVWDLPGLGLEPVSPTLAGRFLTTAPPGKPPCDSSDGSSSVHHEISAPHSHSGTWVPSNCCSTIP